MRVILDTGLLISYLRSTSPTTSAVGTILQAASRDAIRLLLVEDVIDELVRTITGRPDLNERISQQEVSDLVQFVEEISNRIERLPAPYPEIGRDRKDDFVIAHGVVARADFLVSWDKDLTDLAEVEGMRVVTPAELLAILREQELL